MTLPREVTEAMASFEAACHRHTLYDITPDKERDALRTAIQAAIDAERERVVKWLLMYASGLGDENSADAVRRGAAAISAAGGGK